MRLSPKFLLLLTGYFFAVSGLAQVQLKKDGSPDRHYKENRSSARSTPIKRATKCMALLGIRMAALSKANQPSGSS